MLARAGKSVGGAVRQEVDSQWCDAVPLLTCLLWAPCRSSLASPGLRSTISAVQSWTEVSPSPLPMWSVGPHPVHCATVWLCHRAMHAIACAAVPAKLVLLQAPWYNLTDAALADIGTTAFAVVVKID